MQLIMTRPNLNPNLFIHNKTLDDFYIKFSKFSQIAFFYRIQYAFPINVADFFVLSYTASVFLTPFLTKISKSTVKKGTLGVIVANPT